MKIKVTKKGSKPLNEFLKKAWASEDIKHYGATIPWEQWKHEEVTLEAYDGETIVGSLQFVLNLDIAFIELFIVTEDKRGAGVGKELLRKAEELAKKHKVHKIYLQTGRDWDSVPFYISQGYTKTGDLPNHYRHKDFIELTKFL